MQMVQEQHKIIKDRTWRYEKSEETDYRMIQINREDRKYHSRSHDDLWMTALQYLRRKGPRPAFHFFYILRATSTQYHNIIKELVHYGLIKHVLDDEQISKFTKHAKTIVEITDKGNRYFEMMNELAKLIDKPANLSTLVNYGLDKPTMGSEDKRRFNRGSGRTTISKHRYDGLSCGKAAYTRRYDSSR